jgi:hypothetical protein
MSNNRSHLSDEAVHALTLSTEPWLSCEECFELSDEFAELVLADPGTAAMGPMFVHLSACPACAEEAESLVALVAETAGVDPTPALARLHSALRD